MTVMLFILATFIYRYTIQQRGMQGVYRDVEWWYRYAGYVAVLGGCYKVVVAS